MSLFFSVWSRKTHTRNVKKRRKIMFDGLKKVGSAFVEKVGNVGKSTAIIGLTAATAVSAMAEETVSGSMTLPETGVDVPELVKLAVTSMGGVVLAVSTGYVAFLLVKKGLKWIGRCLG